MRIYAKQVPPEYQESPLFFEGSWPEKVYVFGNRRFNQHADDLEIVRRGLEEAAGEWDALQIGHGWYNSWIDVLADYLAPWDTRGEYTRAERLKWADLCAQYCEARSADENDILCDALELITGEKWANGTIRGCCQGDWQEIIYPAEYGREWLQSFETEYFNTGTEWISHDEDYTPEDPEEISGYSVYCLGWNEDLIRAEIAEFSGARPEDITLYSFSGWCRSASYTEVGA